MVVRAGIPQYKSKPTRGPKAMYILSPDAHHHIWLYLLLLIYSPVVPGSLLYAINCSKAKYSTTSVICMKSLNKRQR